MSPLPTLAPATLPALAAQIRPRPGEERWLDIPWETKLWSGREQARRQNRPIFLWAMNGNPLGCV